MEYSDDILKLPLRFRVKIEVLENGPTTNGSKCWQWKASLTRKGYGLFHVGSKRDGSNRMTSAHIFSYETFKGPVPDGLQLDHLCRNRGCVNPGHLEPVTGSVNTRRGLTGSITKLREQAKTHCPQGHPYDQANTGYKANGWRYCRTCARERMRTKDGYPKPPNYPNTRKTHCPQGHPYDDKNTYTKPDGRRVCITCHNLQKRRSRSDDVSRKN